MMPRNLSQLSFPYICYQKEQTDELSLNNSPGLEALDVVVEVLKAIKKANTILNRA